MAYADDMVILLRDPKEWHALQEIYGIYAKASNARLNVQKTEFISMSGHTWPEWQQIKRSTGASWHDRHPPSATRYLDYSIYSGQYQLQVYWNGLTSKLKLHCRIMSSRRLTIRGTSNLQDARCKSRSPRQSSSRAHRSGSKSDRKSQWQQNSASTPPTTRHPMNTHKTRPSTIMFILYHD
ncbi:hypothetical protein BC940DRAFT_247490 [Gongronella butleri]|nr:hypothetical protein BC940DRAFT_247490 [Gongronella butleri]